MSDRVVTASAPGKVILAGEHAVVYGRPALVAAVALRTQVEVAEGGAQGVTLDLPDLPAKGAYSPASLEALRERAESAYHAFTAGHGEVTSILRNPDEYVALALVYAAKRSGADLTRPLQVSVRSHVPPGRGMGSSASTAVAAQLAYCAWHGLEPGGDALFATAMEAERLQHGRPSGVDPYVCVHGGVLRYQPGQDPIRLAEPPPPLRLVDTGRPESGTGECVQRVRDRHGDAGPWDEMAETVHALEQALRDGHSDDARAAVRANHRLLARIGVVPEKPAAFIRDVEERGGAAKICGAGAVRGQRAGVVWIMGDTPPRDLVAAYGYRPLAMGVDGHGARIHA